MPESFWTVPKMWKGQDVVVIGGGPSVADTDLSLIHNHRVIGVNTAYQLGEWIDILFFGDLKWWEWHRETLRTWPGLIVTNCPTHVYTFPRKRVLQTNRILDWQKEDPSIISWNYNSGYAAIHLAFLLGAKRIILIGFDMVPRVENRQEKFHWHEEHPAPHELRTCNKHFRTFLTRTENVAQGLAESKVEIFNTNVHSMIPSSSFPKLPLKDVLEKKRCQRTTMK